MRASTQRRREREITAGLIARTAPRPAAPRPAAPAYRTADGHLATEVLGHAVQVPGVTWGVAESLTRDGWILIREPGGGCDLWQAGRVVVDPT